MARTKLALRNANPGLHFGALRAGMKVGKVAYKLQKEFFRRRKAARGAPTSIPTKMGRAMIKVPFNLPKKLKTGLRHCDSLVAKKMTIFKDALVKQVNQIFYYRGIYKATELTRYDNDSWSYGMFAIKTYFGQVYNQGGAIGIGTVEPNGSSPVTWSQNFTLTNCNALAICLDMPTGDFLPQGWAADCKIGNTLNKRFFGMTGSQELNVKNLTALNTGEINADTTNVDVSKTVNNIVKADIQKIYTLSYRYTVTFFNRSGAAQMCYVITARVKNVDYNDASGWNGLSNWINQYINTDRNGAHKRLARGQLPPAFQTVKVRKLRLGGQAADLGTQPTFNRPVVGRIVVKSKPHYVGVAMRPANIPVDTTIVPDAAFYDEKHKSYTYMFVFALPETIMATEQLLNYVDAARVMCVVDKETSYCVLRR